jgi:F-type H+-transporting ATPase subunit a
MQITTDQWILLELGPVAVNATIGFTWLVMALLTITSLLVTRRLSTGLEPGRWQVLLEVIVGGLRSQIAQIAQRDPGIYLPFVGTLFLFIATANALSVVPGYAPPTGSLSTASALAICVFIAVPAYGLADSGVITYLRRYLQPTPFMLPFNIIGELSRTLALAIRLYGNIMSGTVIVGILIGIAPFVFPIVMQLLGLLTGLIQAYIFAVLATVYIAAATREPEPAATSNTNIEKEDSGNG